MNFKLISTLSLITLALMGCNQDPLLSNDAQIGPNPELPEATNYLIPPMQVPEYVGWQNNQRPKVAEGLVIEKIADELLHPRQVYALPNNDILVVEANGPGEAPTTTPKQLIASLVKGKSGKGAKGGNRITLLRKTNLGEWNKYILLENLHSPFGIQHIGETLYVANTHNIMKYPFKVGQLEITESGKELTDLPNTVNHHWTKAMVANSDGTKLYIGVGSNSNVGENGLAIEYRRATVLEVDINSGASRIYASGIRNPTGLQIEPNSNKLWAVVNERDEIGSSLVPDYLTSVQDGGFYGWPYSYFGEHLDPRVKNQRPDLVKKAIHPDYALGSHVAPLGLWFSSGNHLPPRFQNGAFVSNHGSWNRSPLNGYNVVFISFQNGKPVGKPKTVVSGFYSEDERKLYGAPVGLTQDQTGALIIADDVGKTVWRVSSKS